MKKEYPLNTNYIVYSDGRIYSKRFNKFLTPKLNWDGYQRIQMWKNGKCNMISWHRIIAQTFIENPNNYDVVNHKNGIKSDNRVENLEWCTQQQNIIHAWKTGLSKGNKKVDMLDLNNTFIQTFENAILAGKFINRHPSGITHCCRNEIKTCGNYKWRYSKTSND